MDYNSRRDKNLAQHTEKSKGTLVKFLAYPHSFRRLLARRLIEKLSMFSYADRLEIGALERPHYGYCIFQAARLAALLRYPRISVIEFGCGGGKGLLNAEMHIAEVMKIFPVEIELYGFDIGSGLPDPKDYRDMPHYFQTGLYEMNCQPLEKRLARAKLVIGDVADTCSSFLREYSPAPIGCIFHDLDFYSSTIASLAILDAHASSLLPRIFMYFDDIVGNNDLWLCSEFTGERLAIKDFNEQHEAKKISKNYYARSKYRNHWWANQAYVFHDFLHPRYNDFIGSEEQITHESAIKLRSQSVLSG